MEEDKSGAKRAVEETCCSATDPEPSPKKLAVKPARRWGDDFSSQPEQEMWLGGLVPAASTLKKVRAILWDFGPQGVETGHVKVVIRRGFRVRTEEGKKQWRGYAIVAFSTPEVAAAAIKHFDDLVLTIEKETFKLKAKKALPRRPRRNARKEGARRADADTDVPVNTNWNLVAYEGADPPLEKQLEPLTTEALRERIKEFAQAFPDSPTAREAVAAVTIEGMGRDRQLMLNSLVKLYSEHPRSYREVTVANPAPPELCTRLLSILKELVWPPKRNRKKLVADRYLVVWRDKHLESYKELRSAAEELLLNTDASYSYSHLAITKNFMGSPHIDRFDESYQYAISFGDFTGGELCVETEQACGREVAVVNTKNKLVKVDGRFVHWVRRFSGERYSIIYFSTNKECGTPQDRAVYDTTS